MSAPTKAKPISQASVDAMRRHAETPRHTTEGESKRSGPGSATRILRVLECYLPTDHDLSLSQIAARLSMTKSSVHRALTTLSEHGLVEQDPVTRRYRLGIRLFEIGAAAIHQRGLHGAAHPALVELATATGEACHLAVLSRTEAVYIYKIDGTSNFSMTSRVGGRAPIHCTSIGKVLLAWGSTSLLRRLVDGGLRQYTPETITLPTKLAEELERVRAKGYALDDGEYEVGLRCVAAPIRDHAGAVVAAIGIAGPASRLTDDYMVRLIPLVQNAGATVSRSLGYLDSNSHVLRLAR